jgi:uncharacterized protein
MKIEKLNDTNLVARGLTAVARAMFRRRRWFLFPQLALFVICVVYTWKFLEFDTKRSNLVGSNKRYHQIYLDFRKEFQTADDLVVVVESEDSEKNRQFVERLGARLEAETNLFQHVFYRGDLNMLGSKALLFVSDEDLVELQRRLKDYRPFIQQFSTTTNLNSLFNMINSKFRTAAREENAENKSLINAIPALERIIRLADDCLHRPGTPPSPGVTALFNPGAEAEQKSYVSFKNGRIFLVTAQAVSPGLNKDAVDRMRQLMEETRLEVPGLNIGFTGEPVLEHDEMRQSQRDTTLATIVSLIICALIFIYGYQETGRPIKATLCLIVGLGYTMGFTTLTVGHLNILTITFVPILIGLAIDYGVHLISRYEEELRHGKTEEEALTKAMVYTGQGIFTGALTTAGAFLAMILTDFKGIQEMGVICGGGLLICLIPMLTLLPVLLLRGRQNVIDHAAGDRPSTRARLENLWLDRPVIVTLITLACCGLAATQLKRTYFDYNLLNMQSKGLPAVEFEHLLIKSTPKSVIFAALVATNLPQALEFEERAKALPTVAGVETMTRFLAEDQTRKLRLVNEIKADLAGLRFLEPDTADVRLTELTSTLYSFYGYLGAAHDSVEKDDPKLAAMLAKARSAVGEFRKHILDGDRTKLDLNARKLAAFQQALFKDLRQTFETLKNQDTSAPLRVEDLPRSLRDRFVGLTGKHLVMVYPKEDVWQRDNQTRFIADLRRINENVTGTPVQLYEYTTLLKSSYEQAAKYAFIAIILMVFIHFRNLISVVLAMVPVGIGFLWLGGFMGYFGVPLNPANIMMLPLVIGIGVTNGIHILNRFAEEQTPSLFSRSTGKAVLVSGLTSIAGFGSLALAQHRGIQSLGLVMGIGLATCMVAGLTFLPALLTLLLRYQNRNRPNDDNARSPLGREEPR